MTSTETHTYTIVTDAFRTTVEAQSLDDAIKAVTWDLGPAITDEDSLRRAFEPFVDDGGWCRIDEDGITVFEVGEP